MVIGQIAPNCQPPTPSQPDHGDPPPPDPEPDPTPDPIPDPTPDPDPIPEPDPGSFFVTNWRDQWSDLHGVNLMDQILHRSQKASIPSQTNTAYVNRFLDLSADSGFNVIRIPVTWESYEGAENIFLSELELIMSEAQERGIAIWVENHHWYATSNWNEGGAGFPKSLTDCYDPADASISGGYETDPEVRQFWDDYYNNDMRDRSNGCNYGLDVWKDQADFLATISNRLEGYSNFIGIEIINEPHIWENSQYAQLGDLHTYTGARLKAASPNKAVIFTRETTHGFNQDGTPYGRSVGLEPFIIPRIGFDSELIYAPHVYDLPRIDVHISNFNTFLSAWTSDGYTDIRIAIGEFATQPPQLPTGEAITPENMAAFVSGWGDQGWAFTYWAMGGFFQGEGNVLANSDGTLTTAGIYYRDAIADYFNAPILSGLSAGSLLLSVDICAVQFAQTQSTIFMLMSILSFGLVIKFVLWIKDRFFY